MQCRYCGIENLYAVRICVSCNSPLAVAKPQRRSGKTRERVRRQMRTLSVSRLKPGNYSHSRKFARISGLTSATSQRPLSSQTCDPAGDSAVQMQNNSAAATEDTMQSSPPGSASNATHRFATPDYERLRSLAALYDKPQRAKRRPMYRTVLMLFTFAVGASAGLAATWWLSGARSAPPSASFSRPLSIVSASGDDQATSSPRSGISASELPYDGRRQPSAVDTAMSTPEISPEELPYGGQALVGKENHAATESARQPKKTARPASQDMVMPARVNENNEALQASPRKPTKTYRSARRLMKDREIERIRQQADEELKKKSERRRAINEMRTHVRSATGRTLNKEASRGESHNRSYIQTRFAKCARAGNLIQREQCKWRLCNGMWGKNGCPSYAHATPY